MSGYSQHFSVDIAGAINNKAFDMFDDDDGKPMPADKAEAFLRSELAKGHKLIPSGDCDNFSPLTGCLGHQSKPDTNTRISYQCGICGQQYVDRDYNTGKAKEAADKCCICNECYKPITDNDPKLGRGKRIIHDACHKLIQAKREEAIIKKATVREDWDGPLSWGDRYYQDMVELEESLLDYDIPEDKWPKYAYGTKPTILSIDPSDLFCELLERNGLDSDFIDILHGKDDLEKAIAEFNKVNQVSNFYEEDLTVVVPIQPKKDLI